MRRILLISLLAASFWLLALGAHAAVITASGNASLSSNTNWTGGSAPNCTTDQVATGAFTVTMDVNNCIIGVKSSGVGIGINVSTAAGKFQCAANMTLTIRGFDSSTNAPWKTVANSTMDLSNCVSVLYDVPTPYASAVNNGNYLDSSTTVSDIPAGNITWSNASGNNVYSATTSNPFDSPSDIFVIKMENTGGSLTDPGPISNNAGNGLGAFGNTSWAKVSGGFSGTTATEVDCTTVFSGAATIASVLTTNGQFCIDYPKGMLYYKSGAATLTITFTFKYGTWPGWGIVSSNNAANSAVTINGTYNHCGDVSQTGEQVGGCHMVDNKYASGAAGADATRLLTFGSSVVFNYAFRPLSLYSTSIAAPADATHHFVLTSPTFNNCRYNSGAFQDGLIQLGYMMFVDITNPVLNSATNLFVRTGRTNGNSQKNIIVSGATGNGSNGGHIVTLQFPPGRLTSVGFGTGSGGNGLAGNSAFKNAVSLNGFNNPDVLLGNMDGAMFATPGDPTDGSNTYDNNQINYGYRDGRLDNYMVVTNNRLCRTSHHGFTLPSGTVYVDGSTITFKNNITCDLLDTNNFPGGITFSYNQTTWLDSLIAQHETFDGGTRCFNFNDQESSVALITRVQVLDSICSNSNEGIYKPAYNGTTNVSSIAIAKNDYNLDYNNTNATNLTQATFMRSGAEYNTGTRNVTGVYLFNPQGYTLPDATSRSLVLTAAGVAGTNLSLGLVWSGGASVNFVQAQGTLTAYSTTSCPDGNTTCSLLTDSGASFTASDGTHAGLRTYQVLIASGTGSGQYCMVVSNTATALTCLANRKENNRLVTPLDNTSKYVILKPDQQLLDSGASNSVRAGVHAPTLVLTTQTDSGITMALNKPTSASPNYVNATLPTYNYHPKLATLNNTASDGTFIGALSIQLGTIPKHRGGVIQ